MRRVISSLRSLSKRSMIILILASIIVLCVSFLTVYNLCYFNKIYPNIYIAGFNVGGLTTSEAASLLETKVDYQDPIILRHQEESFSLPANELSISYDYSKSALIAFNLTRTGNYFYDIKRRLSLLLEETRLGLSLTTDENKLNDHLLTISGQLSEEPVYPSVQLVDGEIHVDRGTEGIETDKRLLYYYIIQHISTLRTEPIQIPMVNVDPTLDPSEVNHVVERSSKYLDKTIRLFYNSYQASLSDNLLFSFINPYNGFLDEQVHSFIEKISPEIESDPKNAIFSISTNPQSGKITYVDTFVPAREGIKIDRQLLANLIVDALVKIEKSSDQQLIEIEIPVNVTPPEITTDSVNSYGIEELIGTGISYFRGSISSRIHNINLASSKFNGILLSPGETISFNKIVGDVSQLTGYKQAYIIKDGKTVLGDGGGVCQVSTTLFRAALNAGLKIAERHPHSYRVAYYEQGSPPGLDATVYHPTADLKIENNTNNHVLIQTNVNSRSNRLVFNLYGKSDGRGISIGEPIVSDVQPPPEDLYIDDPNLPIGTEEQIDWKAWGAKVNFTYTVEKDSETIFKKTYYSNYRPWQAVFLRGTGPILE